MKKLDLILGDEGKRFVELIDELKFSNLTTEYPFMDIKEIEKILRGNQKRGMLIYWNEILFRAHFCSVIAILRTRRWISSLLSATRDKNLLSFAAALRGFIESAADSATSLSKVPLTLSQRHSEILGMLSGKSDQFLVSSELEGELIHFAYARHLSKSEAKIVPPQHRARHVRDYINILEQGNVQNVVQCYRAMCDLTHPGQSSVWMWLSQTRNTVCLSAQQDETLIRRFVETYKETFVDLMMFGFNPPIVTLRLLNYFPIPRLHTTQLNNWNLSSIPSWQKCQDELEISRGRSSKGLLDIQ